MDLPVHFDTDTDFGFVPVVNTGNGIARLTMIQWDRMWMELMHKQGLSIEDAMRYMDDLRVFMYRIQNGWRWHDGELCWKKEWELEDVVEGVGDLERTARLLKESFNGLFKFLQFTIETELDFMDTRLPTLDFKL